MNKILRVSVGLIPYRLRTWIRHIPGIAALQRWLLRHLASAEPFLHTINAGPAAGLQFEITLPMDKAIWAGTYEFEFAKAVAQKVKAGDVCYDIGSYRGYMAGVMALAGASKVFAFEPLPSNQKAMRRLCQLNPKLPIELVPAAVGNVDARTRFKVSRDPSMGKLISSSFQPESDAIADMEVTIQRIDTQVEKGEVPPPNLIKIDVEGAELDVLEGAAETLKLRHPPIFLEAHSAILERDCTELLTRLGYRVERLERNAIQGEQPRHLIAHPINAA